MIKKTVFALLGLAFVLALANPPKANAGVVFGVGVGPVFVPRPAYGYGYVHPRPYAYSYGYAPVYARPHYVYPPYGYYGHVYRGGYWGHPVERAYRGYGWRGGYRR
jgi:hypothetical protein